MLFLQILLTLFLFCNINFTLTYSKLLTKADILSIPYIDCLSPIVAYYKEKLNLNFSTYLSNAKLIDLNSEYRLQAKLIWIVNWKDERIESIKDDVYYLNNEEIWTPEIHSWTNDISDEKIKTYYTDTISVRKNGIMESIVFEDYETLCKIAKNDLVSCDISFSGYFEFQYNFLTNLICHTKECIQLTEAFLKISNESKKWRLESTSMVDHVYENNGNIITMTLHFKRNIEILYKIVNKSPIILVILLLSQFFIPIYSKERYKTNALIYSLIVMMVINVHFAYFNIHPENESQLLLFYSITLLLFSILWLWNGVAGNLWISCDHSYEPPLNSFIGSILSKDYLKWIIPIEVLESKSILMKLIILIDRLLSVFILICLICLLIYAEKLLSYWNF